MFRARRRSTVAVLVLGDGSHSPRITSHANSLLSNNYFVHFLSYNKPPSNLLQHPNANTFLQYTQIPSPSLHPSSYTHNKFLFLLLATLVFIWRTFILSKVVLKYGWMWKLLIVQNPPCIPTFLVLTPLKLVMRWPVIIDWHNLGFTILQSIHAPRVIIKPCELYERVLGRHLGDVHFCVSIGLRNWLVDQVGVEPIVLYDRPRGVWKENIVEERVKIVEKVWSGVREWEGLRVRVVVSSTSWTPDEDIGILLKAIIALDRLLKDSAVRVLVVITGRGPMREEFERLLEKVELQHVHMRLVWLKYSDYLMLLRSADVGVSLHQSSSGLDLPMKVVDMFGCGIPVLAYRYKTVEELVLDGENGYLFDDANSLTKLLAKVLVSSDVEDLKRMRGNIRKHFSRPEARWDKYWDHKALSCVKELLRPKPGIN